ncbi:KH domain-containing protein [Patescibacteria group bacterium]|nr:KH domain-containing protein [Patescibacteria group bacterium]
MINADDLKKIKEWVGDFFKKMTIEARIDAQASSFEVSDILREKNVNEDQKRDSVKLNLKIEDPQILIGEKGQTLNEIQRILRTLLNKKIEKNFYLDLDINDYKKKKMEYLQALARDLANEAVLNKEPKILSPMSSYERRIIHTELSGRTDIKTESEGEGPDRKVVIRPR